MDTRRHHTLAGPHGTGLAVHPERVLKVCFVVPGFYQLLNPSVGGQIGGSESRALLIARELAGREDYEVSSIAFDSGQSKVERYEGITVHRDDSNHVQPSTRSSKVGWMSHLRSTFRHLRQRAAAPTTKAAESTVWATAGADVYCSFGVADYTYRLARWCREVGKPLALFAGSDIDVSEQYRPDSAERNVFGSRCDLCYLAIMQAHTIVVQTQTQARLLSSHFGRRGVVIANPIDLNGAVERQPTGDRQFVLWIGKSNTVKRPDLVIDLARMCPEVSFKMVMNRAAPDVFERILREHPSNVEIVERVPPNQISKLYQGAFALLNTSPFEGFPNAFLEAGKYAVPVLSLLVDPDDVIVRHHGGMVADGDLSTLADAVRSFHAEPERTRRAGRNLQVYVRRYHALPDRVADYDRLFKALSGNGYPGRA